MTEEQKKMMRTQDINYVEMKRVAEVKVTFNFHVINHAEEKNTTTVAKLTC